MNALTLNEPAHTGAAFATYEAAIESLNAGVNRLCQQHAETEFDLLFSEAGCILERLDDVRRGVAALAVTLLA
jgi:hypothetical protein